MVRTSLRTSWNPCTGECSFAILKNGRKVYSQESFGRFRIGSINANEKQDHLIATGKDITGDGEPNVVVVEFTGGAHCCLTYHIFQLGRKFRKIATIEAGDSDAIFTDLDGDGKLEVELFDSAFAYFPGSYADSYLPLVILRYKDGAYHPATDLMSKPAPTWGELEEMAQSIRAAAAETVLEPAKKLWHTMIKLVYTGNAEVAWRFFEKAWDPDQNPEDRKQILKEFRGRLQKSPYWPAIKAMNGL